MGQGHRGRDLSSAPDKQPVWLNLGLDQPQTLVPGQFGMHAPSIGWAFRQRFLKGAESPGHTSVVFPTSHLH